MVCRRAHVLFTLLCLFAHNGVRHILCCVFVLFFFTLCTLCFQFLGNMTLGHRWYKVSQFYGNLILLTADTWSNALFQLHDVNNVGMHFVRNKITFADNKGLISEIQRLTDYTMAKSKRTKDKPLLTQKTKQKSRNMNHRVWNPVIKQFLFHVWNPSCHSC
jgi:hypothetical protein